MSETRGYGRLCNTVIRNIVSSLLAEKHNLNIVYHDAEQMNQLGLGLFVGSNNYTESILMNEENYWELYNMETLYVNFYTSGCFQSKKYTNILYDHLRKETVKRGIVAANPFKQRYGTNQDLFIHIRLGDVIQYNPGLAYYLKAIASVSFDKLYIASDSPWHSIVQEICQKYPAATVLDYNPVQTIQFGSTCKNIVLSHGTFSAVIGYLAYDSTVYYPPFEEGKLWHGDCFSIDGWNQVKMD